MRLYDEVFKNADGGAFSRCIVVPRGGGYFEGVKSVGDFSAERIVVCFPRETVEVEGRDLQLSGQIHSIRVVVPQTEGGN